MKCLYHVVGARPNFVKAAPVLQALRAYSHVRSEVVHTGQHYDDNLFRAIFADLELAPPDHNLGVGSGSHAEQTAGVMIGLEALCRQNRPDWMIVYGDVNSTLAAGLVAAKGGIALAHVEAGLRSHDRSMPEEINRLVADALADCHFTTCRDADQNLLREGHAADHIHFVGNTMVDSLLSHQEHARARNPLPQWCLEKGQYALATLHRAGNVDDPSRLEEIVAGIERTSALLPVLFALHPRTRKQLHAFGLFDRLDHSAAIHLTDALGYLDFLHCTLHARLVITDSGGLQEETAVFGVPCLTLRPNTERPVTIARGTSELVRADREMIAGAVRRVLNGEWKHGFELEGWDGLAGQRLAAILAEHCR